MNNLNELAEDQDMVLENVRRKALKVSRSMMGRIVNAYAGERTKSLFKKWMSEEVEAHV